MSIDASNGWDEIAEQFIALRSTVGASTVRAWCKALPDDSAVLDLGCGSGLPISGVLSEAGCKVYGIDASPRLVDAFRRHFPQHQAACEAAETSSFFGMQFDGVVAIGLLFLLAPAQQREVIARVSAALKPDGRFLFSAPVQQAEWMDLMTGHQSISLGDTAYQAALQDAGLRVAAEYMDEGGNHYYDAVLAACTQEPNHEAI